MKMAWLIALPVIWVVSQLFLCAPMYSKKKDASTLKPPVVPAHVSIINASNNASKVPIPVMILVGGARIDYCSRVLDGVLTGNEARQRHLFLVGENAVHSSEILLNLSASTGWDLLQVHVLDVQVDPMATAGLTRPERLKFIWYAAMESVWNSPHLADYHGDIVFLEDDVVPAPDFFHALDFACAAKRARRNVIQLAAMGGWGGENQAGADSKTFTMKVAQAFPTMGYVFDRALWTEILRLKDMVLQDRANTDWAESLSQALCTQARALHYPAELASFHRCGHVQLIQPTLSRVWHIGVRSQVGSLHESSVYKWPTIPSWARPGYSRMLNASDATVLHGMRDVYGFESREWSMAVSNAETLFPPSMRHGGS
jgi:hypothetical protein